MALLVSACGGGTTGPSSRVASLTIVSGNNQTGFVGLALGTPLVVKVLASDGNPVAGVLVTFRVTSGAATVSPASVSTDANGVAQTQVTFGATAGNVTVTASVEGSTVTATFVEVSGTSNVTLACQSGAATVPVLNQVTVGLSGTGICLGGGSAGADYALIPFNRSQVPGGVTSITVTGRGVSALSSNSIAASSSYGVAQSSRGLAASVAPLVPAVTSDLRSAFDARLRQTARRELSPLIPMARQWRRSRGALRNVIPSSVQVGQILQLNANGDDGCTNARYRGGRVVAVTSRAIVVADTLNPTPGFSDAQYQSIGVTFDTLIDPLDRGAFGDPSDIDGNGKVLIFYTSAVNQLTPAGSTSFVGGFFFERDLFPTTSTPQLQGCPGSNVGEMFYMLVPDPNGTINGNKRDTAFVRRTTISTVAHEYQHLINAGRRIYVNDADDFEEVWLNEGLSHIAEELLFYRVTGLSPRQNINAAAIRASSSIVDAFNDDEGANFGRYEEFLKHSTTTSPYADNDSLPTRGATWALLRYLADHRGSADGDAWMQLDNSKTAGLANLQNVFGADVLSQVRDWFTSVFTDDLVSGDARFQQPSWNYRNVFAEGYRIAFPLLVTPLSDGAPATLSLYGGGGAYLRFTVPANGQASVDWSGSGAAPVSPLVQWTMIRTR